MCMNYAFAQNIPQVSMAQATNDTNDFDTWALSCNWSVASPSLLSGWISSSNLTGIFVNTTWAAFGSSTWSNVTLFVNVALNTTVSWILYANSSDALWNSTTANWIAIMAPNATFLNMALAGIICIPVMVVVLIVLSKRH